VLVEGWGYAAQTTAGSATITEAVTADFWDPERLRLNDALSRMPSQTTLEAVTDAYPVRWLLVDQRFESDVDALEQLLPEHEEFGDTVVFRVE
jgi:hypothetical protein